MTTTLQHSHSKHLTEEVRRSGWSWGAFLLGPLWYLFYGMWGKSITYMLINGLLIITIIGPIIMWFVMGKKFNREHYEYLLNRGYREID